MEHLKPKSYKCGACGHVQARGKVWRKGWSKCRACDSCGATSWIPQIIQKVNKEREKQSQCTCVLCNLPIDNEEERQWAPDNLNHPGVLGPVHKKCYAEACDKAPDLPWQEPLTGRVDYDAMKEDLGVIDGTEPEEELY